MDLKAYVRGLESGSESGPMPPLVATCIEVRWCPSCAIRFVRVREGIAGPQRECPRCRGPGELPPPPHREDGPLEGMA